MTTKTKSFTSIIFWFSLGLSASVIAFKVDLASLNFNGSEATSNRSIDTVRLQVPSRIPSANAIKLIKVKAES